MKLADELRVRMRFWVVMVAAAAVTLVIFALAYWLETLAR